MIPRLQLSAILLVAAVAWGVLLILGGTDVTWTYFKPFSQVIGVVVIAHGMGLLFMLLLVLLAREHPPAWTAFLWGAAAGLLLGGTAWVVAARLVRLQGRDHPLYLTR